MQDSIKIAIALSEEEIGGGPIKAESVWCRKESNGLRVKNIPLFKEGIAYGDLISVSQREDGTSNLLSIIEESPNSTVWVYIRKASLDSEIINIIKKLGCAIEGGSPAGNYAVNVPQAVDISSLALVLQKFIEGDEIIVDYPTVRQ